MTLMMLGLSMACTPVKGDTAAEETEENEEDTSVEDTVEPPPSYFEPTFLGFAIEAPYANNEISSVTYGGTTLGGTFIVILTDQENLTTTYYDPTYSCWLTFEFDNSMVTDATATAITDEVDATTQEPVLFTEAGGWLAWTINASAYVGKEGACENLDPIGNWGATIAALETANYGFGFGALTTDLEAAFSDGTDWATDAKYTISGYVGTDAIDGTFKYYDTNRGLAFDISSGELTTDDTGAIANTKIDFSSSVFMEDNGYYSGSPYFGWGFQ